MYHSAIRSYADLKAAHERSSHARKLKGARKFSSNAYSVMDDDGTISIGQAVWKSNLEGHHFNPWIKVTPDGILTATYMYPDFRIMAMFGLHVVKSRTVKKRGAEFTDLAGKPPQKFWQSEPVVFDLKTRKSQNEDFTEMTWDKEKSKEFNRWMRGLRTQFITRAKLGVLITPESAPHFYGPNVKSNYYPFWHWGNQHLKNPLKVFQAIEFEDPKELIPFTKVMRSQLSRDSVQAAFPPEHQIAEIERIFRANRFKLQEQYGARQYTCSEP